VNITQVYSDQTSPNVVFKDFNLEIKDIKDRGQLQRVAIAYNLVVSPQIMLMDELFGALDAITRKQVQLFLRSIF